MTIHLPENLENSILATVHNGEFASLDDAMAAAARLLLDQLKQREQHGQKPAGGMGSIGAMREDADFLDEVVEHAMKARQEQPWRLSPGE